MVITDKTEKNQCYKFVSYCMYYCIDSWYLLLII